MAWIESHQELGRHPKTKRLAQILNISVPTAMGHLHLLWHWAMDYAQDGDLSAYNASEIADAAQWEGDPKEFMTALIECGPGGSSGFVDSTDESLYLHDWLDYAGKLMSRREANKNRQKRYREHQTHTKTKHNRNVTRDKTRSLQSRNGATVPNRTQPYPTKPNTNTTPSSPPQGDVSAKGVGEEKPGKYSPEFEEFWQAYPRRDDKRKAHRCWCAHRKDGVSPEGMIRAARHYAEYVASQGTEERFIKLPATFLSQKDKPFEGWLKPREPTTVVAVDPNAEAFAIVRAKRAREEAAASGLQPG